MEPERDRHAGRPGRDRGRDPQRPLRIPDWTSLDAAARQNWQSSARRRASALNTALNAFVKIEPAKARIDGASGGLPYAAKDMLRTPKHRPSGGFAEAGDLGIVGNSDLLDRLDEAGADRIGFTQMTELAYEPSGFNAARGRVKESVEPGPRPRRFVVRVGGGCCERCGGRCTRFGHRRLAPHPGALLRCHGLEADCPYGAISTRGAMPLAPSFDTIGILRVARLICCRLFEIQPIYRNRIRSEILLCWAMWLHYARATLRKPVRIWQPCCRASERQSSKGMPCRRSKPSTNTPSPSCSPRARASTAPASMIPPSRLSCAAASRNMDVADATLAASINARPRLIANFEQQVLAGADAAILPIMAIPTPTAAECDPDFDRFSPRTLRDEPSYPLRQFARISGRCAAGRLRRTRASSRHANRGRPRSDLALLDLVRHVQSKTEWHGRAPTAVADLLPQLETAS